MGGGPCCFPAKAGTQSFPERRWAPAFAGEQRAR